MRNLKKILALVLALVMSMSLVSVAGAKYTVSYDDADQIADKYMEAAAVLSGIGVYQGNDNKFLPKDTITRAEVATIIYRIVTGDVKGEDIKLYEDMNKFEDCVDPTTGELHWAAGYINFCANQNIVQGYNPKTFGPDDAITGYQAVLMLLRAIGWDKNGESNSDDWRQISAGKAQLMGWTTGISEYQLAQHASREMVAQILLRAIQQPQLSWTLLTDYSEYADLLREEKNESLGWANFKLAKDETVRHTTWGRPYHAWTSFGKEIAQDKYEAVATYTEAIAECDVAEELNISDKAKVVYLTVNNTVDADNKCDAFDGEYINATHTKKMLGAQGRLTEIYKTVNGYEIVMIDEFLTRVTDVVEVEYDRNEHITHKAELHLDVWFAEGEDPMTVILTSKTDWEYEVDEFLLLNFETVGTSTVSEIVVDSDDYYAVATDPYKILGNPETFEGTQSIWNNEDSHTVNKTKYPDNVRFSLDEAEDSDDEFLWILDSTNENLIGVIEIQDVYSYGTISTIKWVDENDELEDGYAKAKITFMDKTTDTIIVHAIKQWVDGELVEVELEGVEGEAVSYAGGKVSSSTQKNKNVFTNQALYKLTKDAEGNNVLVETTLLEDAQCINGVPALTTKETTDINAGKSTLFLVWYNDGTGYDYYNYEGFKKVPTYDEDSGEFWYVDVDDDKVAEYVFIIDPTITGTSSVNTTTKTFFAFEEDDLIADRHIKGNIQYYVISGGLVDGVEGEVKVKNTEAGRELMEYIKENSGKLMVLTITNGYVVDAETVTDVATTFAGGYAVYAGAAQATGNKIRDGVLTIAGESYDIDEYTLHTYDRNLSNSIKYDEKAYVYVVYTMSRSNEATAKFIYIINVEGDTYEAPETATTLADAIAAVETAITALKEKNAAVKNLPGYTAAALTSTDAHTLAYVAIANALKALDDAVAEMNAIYTAMTTADQAANKEAKDIVEVKINNVKTEAKTAQEATVKAAIANVVAIYAAATTDAAKADTYAKFAPVDALVADYNALSSTDTDITVGSAFTSAKSGATTAYNTTTLTAAKNEAVAAVESDFLTAVKNVANFSRLNLSDAKILEDNKSTLDAQKNALKAAAIVSVEDEDADDTNDLKSVKATVKTALESAAATYVNGKLTATVLPELKADAIAALEDAVWAAAQAAEDAVYITLTKAAVLEAAAAEITGYESAINGAATIAALNTVLENQAKTDVAGGIVYDIDAVVTAMVGADTVGAAKLAAVETTIAGLLGAKTDYSTEEQADIATVVDAGVAAVIAAKTTDEVAAALAKATKDINDKLVDINVIRIGTTVTVTANNEATVKAALNTTGDMTVAYAKTASNGCTITLTKGAATETVTLVVNVQPAA